MKRLLIIMCLLAMIAICVNNKAQEVMISLTSKRNLDTVITKHEDVLSKFALSGDDVIRSQFCFIADGNWNDGSKWNMGEVPPIGSDVVIMADVVIPSGYTAVANEVSIDGGSITVADGGQLRHNTANLVVTMKKSIEPYCEINGIGNYYLLGFPFSEIVDVPAIMTAAPGNDFYKFDSNSSGTEWRNNKQEAVATVGGTNGYLYASPDAIELSLTGNTYTTYHEETKTVTIPYSEDSTNLFNGWALLGNPYTCNAYIYYYNSDNELVPMDYMVYDTNGELMTLSGEPIAPMQGFFVKVTESTMVYIKNHVYHDYVDLGLPSGILWATCNVGANAPEEYGDYFAWGETQPKNTYNWSTYHYCNGSDNTLTKYCYNYNYGYNGFTDYLTTLLPEDDASTTNWGNDWRMPNYGEWMELFQNTTQIWTTQNDVNGKLFTAENGNSLFLPAASLYNVGSYGYYWSSSLSTNYPHYALGFYFFQDYFGISDQYRYNGFSVRPVRSPLQNTTFIIDAIVNPAESGMVSGSGTYEEGDVCVLTAMANEGYTFSNWTENDEVISVDTTYSFIVIDNRDLVANFIVSSGNEHGYVDLGLPSGTLWATCNVGANAPEEYGDYYSWAETLSKDIYVGWGNYQYCNGSDHTLTKYCNNSDFGYNGFIDDLTILLPEDDAATTNWGNDWRIPTKEEWQELFNNTNSIWTTQNGVNGRLFTVSNGNSLFLPAAGHGGYYGNPVNVGTGYYWSSSLYLDTPSQAWHFNFYLGNNYLYNINRFCGCSVRAVRSSMQIVIPPTVTTIQVTNITQTTAICGGNVTNDGGGAVTERGICWSTSHYPTTSGNHANSGTGTGSYSINMTGLTANTTYYVRAYAINSEGTAYGSEVSFTTLPYVTLPTVTTSQVTNITQTTATGGGNVIDTGNATVTERGICWSTSHNPTTSDSHINNGSGTGSYTIGMTDLMANTTYYVCAYATNSMGTAYGNEVSFSTSNIATYTITVSANPSTGGLASGGGNYQQGQNCTLTATASTGYSFFRWTENGAQVSTDESYTFNVTNNRVLVANFVFNGGGTHGYVDLDLPSGLLWATCNVGANVPEEYGYYFAWAETQAKSVYNWNTYQYCMGSPSTLTKYCNNSSYGYNGFFDNLTTLLPVDDVAKANWGANWRMPTKEEWQELLNNTTRVWTTRNGVNGCLFIASNDNCIFIPAAGYRDVNGLFDVGSGGSYWSSSLRTDYPGCAWNLEFFSGDCLMRFDLERIFGHSIRAVRFSGQDVTPPTVTTGEVTNIAMHTATCGGNVTATGNATVTERGICWSTSHDPSISGSHVNNGSGMGSYTIDITGLMANTTYFVRAYATNSAGTAYGNEVSFTTSFLSYVDLSLPSGTMWATFNIGANAPEEYGDYFAWGETTPKDLYSWSNYQYCNGSNNTLTFYCNNPSYGFNGYTDTFTTLFPWDDAATVNWGSDWRIPTIEEWQELYDNTTCTWTTRNGVNGRLFTASNGNNIFLPAAGYRVSGGVSYAGSNGYYWSSSLYSIAPYYAWILLFVSDNCELSGNSRRCGQPVRAVRSSAKN